MFTKILIPLDGSDLSEQVLPKVAEIAKRFPDAVLVLLQVIEPLETSVMKILAVSTVGEIQNLTYEQVNEYLRQVAIKYLPNAHTQIAIGEGKAAEIILQTAKDIQADLVAMASHGRAGIVRFALGSVTDRVISHIEIPVLVVRAS